MKKKLSIAKILTDQHLIGLEKAPNSPKFGEGALFSAAANKKERMKFKKLNFKEGGISPDIEDGPIKTYKGSENYNAFLEWQGQNKNFTSYDNENVAATEKYGESSALSVSKFKADPAFSAFDVPEGATGVSVYNVPKDQQFQTTQGFNGSYYTGEGKAYIPTYDNPGADKYEVVDSPEVVAHNEANAAYTEENADIQGWVRKVYYDNQTRSNQTEMVPLKNGQPVPNDGTFTPKDTFEEGGITNPNKANKNRAVKDYTTTVTTDKEVLQFKGDSVDPTTGATITAADQAFKNSGNINTLAQLNNDVSVDFDGTLEEKEAMLKDLNRGNFAGSKGFRGRGWRDQIPEADRAQFKKDNPFYKKGRSRHLDYDLTGDGERTDSYTQDGVPINQATPEFELGGKKIGEQANAEIEHEEYVKFPDEGVQRGYGEKHSKGGIDLEIPDGTKILSNKLTISKKDVKMLKKDFGIKATTKNTYSQVVDKYVKKIGLSKLYDEQEKLFEGLGKVIDESGSEGAARINKEYLSKKIGEIERQKEDKEGLKESMFDKMFTIQESSKPKESKEEAMQSSEEFFETGGISREAFNKVTEKYGLTEQEGIDLVTGRKSKYPVGGTHKAPVTVAEAQKQFEDGLITREEADNYEVELAGKERIKFSTTSGAHTYSDQENYKREKQSASDGGFGKITKANIGEVLNKLYHQFPDIVAEEYGVTYNEDGTVAFDKNIDFSKMSAKVKNFQVKANKRMKETADLVLQNPESFSPEFVANAEAYKNNETFDDSLARGIDSKQGQFTSGRYSLGIDVITPEEQKVLSTQGIFTTKQLQAGVDDGSIDLSPGSLERLENIRALTPEGSDPDFALNVVPPANTPAEAPPEDVSTLDAPAAEIKENTDIVDGIVPPATKNYPRLFGSPNQTPLPPSAMEAHLLNNVRLERIDPTRIGIETELQQASDSIKAGTEALSHLPPNQRAAAIVGLQANVQKGINESIHKANIVNAQNQSSAELFNIGQAGREEQIRGNNLLSFEQRQLTAKANTEEEVRSYYDQLNKIHVNNFRNNQDLNLINKLAPNYTYNGSTLDFTPEGEFKLQDNRNLKGVI